MRLQLVTRMRTLRRAIEAGIVNQSGAIVPSPERNDPTPPTVSREVIRCGRPADLARTGIARKAAHQFITVPILHVAKARPDGICRMLGQAAQEVQPAREHRRPAARVDDPAAAKLTFPVTRANSKPGGPANFDGGDLCRAPDDRAGLCGQREHVLVKNLAVDLIGRKPNLIKCAQLAAAIEIIVGPLRKPEPQAVLDHMMMAKMVGEPQAFGQETYAHLGRRLTNLAIEPLRPLDHHYAKFRDFAPKQ